MMARKKIIAGNWKMNMTPTEAVALVNQLKPLVVNDEVEVAAEEIRTIIAAEKHRFSRVSSIVERVLIDA